ncbi:rCG53487, isoform CRA_b [Rattus norvegicus]|uniref:RCG53487, isoform CRA_b n=1 Tax=Rattus norvegicus TaxID=10116 RepID=A6JRH5_RAT|nr:rCG53487, isoform CRA_b [Rattus norvegicus]
MPPRLLGVWKATYKGSKLRKPQRSPALAHTHSPAHTQFAPALPPSLICFWENKP